MTIYGSLDTVSADFMNIPDTVTINGFTIRLLQALADGASNSSFSIWLWWTPSTSKLPFVKVPVLSKAIYLVCASVSI